MVTALYRRYRPETFSEMIGQSQVTDPLMTALRADRVNHAYLFSGPRGCGKTTSARILARCLNCAEGPTDTPCGKCDSCIELSRAGGGSLDVVEIDAASHNGVDDARDLRERAIFAPARDRYKIFILDEAHMVTPQGFNALLKLVEEPPEHVKFIFATTEPEKVLGTIRSRTHHYPFRLVPPAQMLEYVQKLCDEEGVKVAPGVLPLVVRAGGGSPRDTLSLLDQLMAGSEDSTVDYERAVALLGFTHGALLDEIIDAIAARDAAGAFAGIDRVIQTGQDPRRFVEDLLERLRDLIVVGATTAKGAAAVLRGIPQDELDRMGVQASAFGQAELSRTADIVNAALTEMTGATSPRLHLELLVARALVPSADDTQRGALARVERLERRVGVTDAAAPAPAAPAAPAAAPAAAAPAPSPSRAAAAPAAAAPAPVPAATAPASAPASASSAGRGSDAVGAETEAPASTAAAAGSGDAAEAEQSAPAVPDVAATAAAVRSTPVGPVTFAQVKDAWPEVLEAVKAASLNAWMVVFTAQVRELRDDDVLVLGFPSQKDVEALKQQAAPGQGVGDYLKRAVSDILGFTPKLIARVETPGGPGGAGGSDGTTPPASPSGPTGGAAARTAAPAAASAPATSSAARTQAASSTAASAVGPTASVPADSADGWATIAIPGAGTAPSTPVPATAPVVPEDAPAPTSAPAPVPAAAPAAPPRDDEPPFDDVPPPSDDEAPFEDPGYSAPQRAPQQSAPQRAQQQQQPARGQRPAAPGQRYGESVVREVLGATFLEEQPHTPKTSFRERA
ncbi:DNA polymerase III subunit gamma and tau [Leifsonia sp. Leaf264]|uniref:DNA polymerase III subunit gamma and tau n=1 Tax=Leifsonia sp. Leaf264 TaxID=1736314 RepID=UPI0006FC8518|nr:DNA polymerase III subunit gamma and tau [Leifsonia sp. Leaf264]KQO95438.1 DNA polymerase III subunit gamma/tau [Leifsonia sp. Leaf264]